MSAPRRYRWALLALPERLRRARGEELLATLDEADALLRGGRPSGREALGLAGYGLRARTAAATLPAAALLALAAALAPSAAWADRVIVFADGGAPNVGADPPAPLLLAALVLVALSALPPRTRLVTATLVPFAFLVSTSPGWRNLLAGLPGDALGALAIGAVLAGLAAHIAHMIPARMRAALLASGTLTAVAATLPRSDMGPGVSYANTWSADLGPAVALALASALLAAIASVRAAGPLLPAWRLALVAAPHADVATGPGVLASDAERDACAARLRQAAAEGRLEVGELDERLSIAYATRRRGDLAALTADLPTRGHSLWH